MIAELTEIADRLSRISIEVPKPEHKMELLLVENYVRSLVTWTKAKQKINNDKMLARKKGQDSKAS